VRRAASQFGGDGAFDRQRPATRFFGTAAMRFRHLILPLAGVCIVSAAVYLALSRPAAPPAISSLGGPERIIDGPELESATDTTAFIRWTAASVSGTRERYGIVHYGTAPDQLTLSASSPTRWNSALPTMVFRVYLRGLRPATTYYYSVDSRQAVGPSDQLDSPVGHFTTATSP
jgi:phosphodiesterase/alkaline phosphatase D-like protein